MSYAGLGTGVYFVWKFSKLPKQYIAAAGDPNATSGTGAAEVRGPL